MIFWRKSFGFSEKKLQKVFKFLSDSKIFSINFYEKSIRVSSDNILKYKDEWSSRKSKNSGVYPDQLPSSRARVQKQNTEIDTDIDPKEDSKIREESNDSSCRRKKNGDESQSKKTNPEKKIFPPESEAYRLAAYMRDTLMESVPTLRDPDLQKWAYEFDKALRNDSRMDNARFVAQVIKWACTHDFWRANIQSPKKLREKFDMLTARMESEAGRMGAMNGNGWKNQAQRRVDANLEAGRQAKILLFGPDETREVRHA